MSGAILEEVALPPWLIGEWVSESFPHLDNASPIPSTASLSCGFAVLRFPSDDTGSQGLRLMRSYTDYVKASGLVACREYRLFAFRITVISTDGDTAQLGEQRANDLDQVVLTNCGLNPIAASGPQYQIKRIDDRTLIVPSTGIKYHLLRYHAA